MQGACDVFVSQGSVITIITANALVVFCDFPCRCPLGVWYCTKNNKPTRVCYIYIVLMNYSDIIFAENIFTAVLYNVIIILLVNTHSHALRAFACACG